MDYTQTKNIQGFPSDFCPLEEKKSKGYILKYFKAMYDAKKKNADFFEEGNKQIVTNRKYAEGMQSGDKYKNWYAIAEGEGDGSYANLDYTPIPIVKKYVQLRLGEMLNTEYEIISKAKKDGVDYILVPATDLKSAEQVIEQIGRASCRERV